MRPTGRSVEAQPLLPITVEVDRSQAPALATPQSWNPHTQRYKCFLCNPVKLGFQTLAELNKHLATPDHEAKRYKCPHNACDRPFNTIGGLVQHIETRSCNCMADSKWWNTYFALQAERGMKRWSVTASPDLEEELDLEEYWMRLYVGMAGCNGRWDYEDSLLRWAGLILRRLVRLAVIVFVEIISFVFLIVSFLHSCICCAA